MRRDPGETQDLLDAKPETTARLYRAWYGWNALNHLGCSPLLRPDAGEVCLPDLLHSALP